MKAIRLHGRGGPEHLVYEDVPQPHPGPGEVLVRVSATGILVNELRWNETYETQAGSKRTLPIPERDLSGVVVEGGPGVTTLTAGAQVYAMLEYGRDGAEADYTIALPGELAPKPRTFDSVQAAAVPLSALTAWQGLFVHASLVAGHEGVVSSLSWVPSEEGLISGSSDGVLRWWQVQNGACMRVQKGHQGTIRSLKVSPDGSRLASCGDDGAIMLWDLERGEPLQTLRRDRPYERLTITGIRGLIEAQKA